MALYEERRRVGIRLSFLQYLIIVIFSVLAVAFWVLQVVQHEKYNEMAENNHQRTLALRAPRGIVFDRNSQPLVVNRQAYSISIVREHTKDLNRTIELLAATLRLRENGLREVVERHRREPSYRPITIIQDASLAQVSAVKARQLELPDVLVESMPTREYPDAMAAHLFGYVGEVSPLQVSRDDTLKSGDIVGQAGIEAIYNQLLMGEDGARRVTVNSVGREIEELANERPTEGKRLQLTIDYDVQKAIDDGFQALGYTGAAVILDPSNGEVLAYTSLPAYNPNLFAAGIDRGAYASLMADESHPFTDRAIQGRFSPGSTFKMAVATAALEEGVITPDFKVFCPGHATFFGRSFKCWKPGGHGTVDLRHAIEQSCNVFFYTVGNMTNIDRIHKWAALLGLGEKSGIDLPNEYQGLVPSPEWKRAARNEKWYAGETISVSIGQGAVSLTPVSMAVYISTIANGGTRVTPHLLKAVDDGNGWKPVPAPGPKSRVEMKPETVQALHDGLWLVVNERGTGGNSRLKGYDVSGKTGTAQVISLEGGRSAKGKTDRDLRDNGWFVFFAPRDNPRIAGAILAEHAEHGSNAALIARHALETFFAKQEGRPLPSPPPSKKPVPPTDRDDPSPVPEPVQPVGNPVAGQ